MRGAEANVNHLTQFVEDRLTPQLPQRIGSVLVTPTVGEEREEQHVSQSRLDRASRLLGGAQNADVLIPADPVVDVSDSADAFDEVALPLSNRSIQPTRLAAENCPRPVGAEYVLQFPPRLLKKRQEVRIRVGAHLRDQRSPAGRHLLPDVLQNDFARYRIQNDLTSGRQEGEAMFDLANEFFSTQTRQSPEALVEAELLALMADEVQCSQHGLAWRRAQPAAELLKKHGRALSGPQEQHGVDIGDVESLIEEVDGEDGIDFAVA
jgi:hypothetical protein